MSPRSRAWCSTMLAASRSIGGPAHPRIRRASQYRTLVEIAHPSLRVRQGVRDQGITRWRHHEVMAAGHDDQILLAILLIDDRRGLAAGGEHVTPQDLACLDVHRLDQ